MKSFRWNCILILFTGKFSDCQMKMNLLIHYNNNCDKINDGGIAERSEIIKVKWKRKKKKNIKKVC